MKRAFYLKINNGENFALRNLNIWLEVSYIMDYDCYIVCDKDELTQKIKDRLILLENVFFIKSMKTEKLRELVNNIAIPYWHNAAFAHLTTFVHAKENGYDYFWNIDADDTQRLLSADRIVEMPKCVEVYARDNDVNCCSLDMHTSKSGGTHWTFGITYTSSNIDWLDICFNHCLDKNYKDRCTTQWTNIDGFFTHLRNIGELKIKTFYFENLRFIHYADDLSRNFLEGMYHWKEGTLKFPLICDLLKSNELGECIIPDDLVKFDINITDNEARDVLIYYSTGRIKFGKHFNCNNIQNFNVRKRRMHKRVKDILPKGMSNFSPIIWGTGEYFYEYCDSLSKIFDIKMVCDNNPSKWNKTFCGLKCISPQMLSEIENALCIIAVYDRAAVMDIENQLIDLGVKNFIRIADLDSII